MTEKPKSGTKVLARITGAGRNVNETSIDTPYGLVKSRPIFVTLEKSVHTYHVKGREMVNSDGYELLAGGAGVRIITPRYLHRYDRKEKAVIEVGNPDIVIDDAGRILAVWIRKVAAGFLPNGELSIVERTLYFNIESYFMTSLMKKVSGKNTAAKVMSQDEWDAKTPKDKEGYAFALTVPELKAGLMITLAHEDVLEVFKERQMIGQMAERRATTICERLVFDHHPAIAQANLASAFKDKMHITIPVISVRHQSAALERLFISLAMGEKPELPDIPIRYDTETVVPTGEVVESEAIAETSEEDIIEGDADEAAPEVTEANEKLSLSALQVQLNGVFKEIDKEAKKQIQADAGKKFLFSKVTDASPEALTWMLAEALKVAGGEIKGD